MNNIIEEYEFENGKITVCQAMDAESPREFGTMVCSHNLKFIPTKTMLMLLLMFSTMNSMSAI